MLFPLGVVGAIIDVWQANNEGQYDPSESRMYRELGYDYTSPRGQGAQFDCRARVRTDSTGKYSFDTGLWEISISTLADPRGALTPGLFSPNQKIQNSQKGYTLRQHLELKPWFDVTPHARLKRHLPAGHVTSCSQWFSSVVGYFPKMFIIPKKFGRTFLTVLCN